MKKIFTIGLCSMIFVLHGNDRPPPGPTILTSNKRELKIYEGWNLLASPINRDFATGNIQHIVDNNVFIFDAKAQSWKSGVGINVAPGMGFWVQVSKDGSVAYQNEPNNQYSIRNSTVALGWNLMGMSAQSERISTISSAIRTKYEKKGQALIVSKVNVYNAQKAEWKTYSPYYQGSVKAGQGFWMEITR